MAEALKVTPEERRAQIDRQVISQIATSQPFLTRLNLPPIPPSPDRPTLVEQRNAKVNDLVRAAAEGRQERFMDIARELGLDMNTSRTLYTDTRSQFLQQKEGLLVAEVMSAVTSGNDKGVTYWMNQLQQNTVERCRLDGANLETRTVEILSSIMRGLRQAGAEDFNARMEDMLYGALDTGFNIKAVFRVCEDSGVGGARSQLPAEDSIRHWLAKIAKNRVDRLIERCGQLYAQRETSPAAEMEFRRAFNQLQRMTEGLVAPGTFTESTFGNQASMQALSANLADRINPYAFPKGYK